MVFSHSWNALILNPCHISFQKQYIGNIFTFYFAVSFNLQNSLMLTTYFRILFLFLISKSLISQNNQTGNYAPSKTIETQNEFGATIVSPSFPNIIFIATTGKIIKSIDNGDHWTTIYAKNGLWVNQFVMPTPNPDIILASTNQGLIRSINGGLDWSPLLPDASKIDEVAKNKTNSNNALSNAPTQTTPTQTTSSSQKRSITNIPNPSATFFNENEMQSKVIPQVSVSPNPASNDGNIKVETNLTGEMKFVLYNDNAQLIKTIKFVNSIEIDLQGTIEGKYFYRVENNSFKMGGVLLVQ
jgi:hypothetical protein